MHHLLRWYRQVAQLLLVALVVGWLPTASENAAAFTSPQVGLDAPADPPPDALTVAPTQPAPDAHLPALALQADVPPLPLAVGDTSTITLTITNGAPDPADDPVVTLPTPDGALALPGPNTISPTAGWQWNLGHLDGASSAVLTATLRLVRMPAGQALLLQPQATARGLSLPTTATGGAVVLPADHGPATVRFTPGAAARLHSRDGRVQVDFPARGFARALTLRAATAPLTGTLVSSTIPGPKRGLGTFFLDATDDQGQDIHQFAQPLTITFGYTPEQLAALRTGEGTLTIFWYDDAQGRWTPLPTTVDSATQTASAMVNHFTPYSLGDGSSPSSTFIPSLQGWQVSGFTGGASYSFPIEVPAGPGGLKPNLTVNYSSATNDSDHYLMTSKQASWAGTSWSLDTGAIALNRRDGPDTNYYSLILNGQSYDIVRGAPLAGSPYSTNSIQGWNWYATDEQFLRVRATTDDSWAVWTKDGTRYDFTTTATWGWGTSGRPTYETYKWLLSSVTDTHQNTITYSYNRYQY